MFRKSVKSTYRPNFNFSGFGEIRQVDSSSDDGVVFRSDKFFTASDISSEALPLFSLDSVVKSGQLIKGSVSFAPNDPTDIESRVASSISIAAQSKASSAGSVSSSDNSNS